MLLFVFAAIFVGTEQSSNVSFLLGAMAHHFDVRLHFTDR